MEQRLYTITEFAEKSSVSTRTLRFYHKKELLIPSNYNKSGYRMYTDEDLIKLQQILALKFLGFTLKEIKTFIETSTLQIRDALYEQRMMMLEKRQQIELIINAIDESERLISENQFEHKSIIKVIEALQEKQKAKWINKYLTPTESIYMRELAEKSYSKDALQKIIKRGWNEEDQKAHVERYTLFRSMLSKLVENEVDPSSKEAQEVGEMLYEMNNNYSKGDEAIVRGMKKSWDNFNAANDDGKPSIYKISENEREYIKKVMIIYHNNRILK